MAILTAARKVLHIGASRQRVWKTLLLRQASTAPYCIITSGARKKCLTSYLEQRISEFFTGLISILSSDLALPDKIRAIVEHDIETISQQQDLPMFILQELSQNPQRLIDYAEKQEHTPRKC